MRGLSLAWSEITPHLATVRWDGILDDTLTAALLRFSLAAAICLCGAGFTAGLAARRIGKLIRHRRSPAKGIALAVIQGSWREYAQTHDDEVKCHLATLAEHNERLAEHDRKMTALFGFMAEAAEIAGISPPEPRRKLELVTTRDHSRRGA